MPHNGLIRYRHLFNRERVLVASPKALGEVLVTRNYEFIKPPQLRNGLGRILGVGILLAEGDEHKVKLSISEISRTDINLISDNARTSLQLLLLGTSKISIRFFGQRARK